MGGRSGEHGSPSVGRLKSLVQVFLKATTSGFTEKVFLNFSKMFGGCRETLQKLDPHKAAFGCMKWTTSLALNPGNSPWDWVTAFPPPCNNLPWL